MNWANLATLCRIVLIPAILACYYAGYPLSAGFLFVLASITDWLDGYLARKLNLTSEFGAFLDPVADKILVVVILIALVADQDGILWPAIIIIGREILVSALREWMAARGQRGSVAVAFSGKLKTTVQLIAISCLLVRNDSSPAWLEPLALVMIWLAAGLALWSMLSYFQAARKAISDSQN